MKVLAIDTSTQVMGVGLIDENHVIGEYVTNVKRNQSIRLMPAIDHLFTHCQVSPQDLDKIVVAKGPGSYTGVRIGVSVAKTLAWSLNIPLTGVSSLEALAGNVLDEKKYVVPLFDARRGQVYTGLYGTGSKQPGDKIVMLVDWLEELAKLEGEIVFIGSDIIIHGETIKTCLGDQAVIAHPSLHNPRPSVLAFLGANRPNDNVHTFVPNYTRMAEAEVNWLANKE